MMAAKHLQRFFTKTKTLQNIRTMSTYNPIDKKFPPDVMNKFLDRLSKYGNGEIILEKDSSSGIAVVTIENHRRKNALTGHMMVALKGIVADLEIWTEGKAVVLRGHGDTFCSGGDLTAVMKEIGTPDEGRMMCEYMQETLTRFMELPLISIAALSGKALGGGAELATACDFRLMTHDAGGMGFNPLTFTGITTRVVDSISWKLFPKILVTEIGFVQSKLAISTGWGGGSRLVKIIGKRRALQLLTTAKLLSYKEAVEFGLVDASLDTNKNATDCCVDWLRNGGFLHAHPKVVQTMKQISVNADDMSLRNALDDERDLFAALWGGSLHNEALEKNMKHR